MQKNKKILLVDDDEPTRQMYSDLFKGAGFEVIEAIDGLEGLEKAVKESPSVIFTGIIMPRMDGFTMMESLKKNIATSNIPVIISSHMGREEDRQKANVLGVRDFIVRDFTTPKKVLEKIKSIFMEEKEYRLEIDTYSMDAQKLAQDLGLNNNFQCMECDERLIFKVISKSNNAEGMEARLICPSCGWQAK